MDKIFEKAAKSALFSWGREDGTDDLVSDLWVWYFESPATQRKLQNSDEYLARRLVYMRSMQILADQARASDRFHGTNPYSPENVKDALLEVSTNRYLIDILPMAMESLSEKNEGYAEAIRVRYTDGVVPKRQSTGQVYLSRAIVSLTDRVNDITYAAGTERDKQGNLVVEPGPGSRHAVFPESRRSSGADHSDPTADIAILLLEHPEVRDDYLHVTPIHEILAGRAA
ncbi:hypothetical protein ASE48_08645 [Mycobacterium sp. Root265]|uniref:hypothetical protein n=1 Tax=Mycobacterium sp. Root265 TaxID=1736504 RepID=UPI00070B05AD|nr:hypothetical protein [Mycobacterium sp. Root265]KRD08620.1 hypothetical protein ASE48_08645 [Mycobacterium sp. Root265]